MEISAAEFRANCLKLIDQVHEAHIEVIITKRGTPMAKLVKYAPDEETVPFLGSLTGVGETLGDLTRPMDADAWELD